MKAYTIVLLLSLATAGDIFPKPASGQSDECSKKVIPYGNKVTARVFTLDLASPGGGYLLYLGAARHSVDPSDPEFFEFENAWNDFKPTIAFYEGGTQDRVPASRDEAITSEGEPGLVMFLAARDKTAAVSLQPSRQD